MLKMKAFITVRKNLLCTLLKLAAQISSDFFKKTISDPLTNMIDLI